MNGHGHLMELSACSVRAPAFRKTNSHARFAQDPKSQRQEGEEGNSLGSPGLCVSLMEPVNRTVKAGCFGLTRPRHARNAAPLTSAGG